MKLRTIIIGIVIILILLIIVITLDNSNKISDAEETNGKNGEFVFTDSEGTASVTFNDSYDYNSSDLEIIDEDLVQLELELIDLESNDLTDFTG